MDLYIIRIGGKESWTQSVGTGTFLENCVSPIIHCDTIAESLGPSKVQGFFTVQSFHRVFSNLELWEKKPCENLEP